VEGELNIYDSPLYARLKQEFSKASESLGKNRSAEENLSLEENLFTLRADVVAAASLLGVSISPIYTYSIFVVLAISALVAFLITLVTKRMVNWELVRNAKAEVSQYMKEHRAASLKRDVKTLHKLEQRKAEINKLQGVMFSQNFKPTIIYTVPLLLLWYVIGAVFSGWVVAWLPFHIDLPIFGPLVTFGFGWWYFITYLGFSQVFRKILIRERGVPSPPAPPMAPKLPMK
jgi:uncharacterized membrane protein (DUF106 family)